MQWPQRARLRQCISRSRKLVSKCKHPQHKFMQTEHQTFQLTKPLAVSTHPLVDHNGGEGGRGECSSTPPLHRQPQAPTGVNLLPGDAPDLGVNTLDGVKPDTPISVPVLSLYSEVTPGTTGKVDTKSTHRESTADVTSTMHVNIQQRNGLIVNVPSEINRQSVQIHHPAGRLCSSPPSVKTPSVLRCPHCEYRTNNTRRLKAERRLLTHMEKHTRHKSVKKGSPKVATTSDTAEGPSSCPTFISSTDAINSTQTWSATRDMATQTIPVF